MSERLKNAMDVLIRCAELAMYGGLIYTIYRVNVIFFGNSPKVP